MGGEAFLGAAQVPLAPHAGGVALGRQQFRDGDLPLRQPVRNPAERDFIGSGADGKAARHERRAGGRALGFHVEVEQPDALGGERVDARRRRAAQDAASVAPELAVAQVVHEHEHDVGLLGVAGSCRPGKREQQKATGEERQRSRLHDVSPLNSLLGRVRSRADRAHGIGPPTRRYHKRFRTLLTRGDFDAQGRACPNRPRGQDGRGTPQAPSGRFGRPKGFQDLRRGSRTFRRAGKSCWTVFQTTSRLIPT